MGYTGGVRLWRWILRGLLLLLAGGGYVAICADAYVLGEWPFPMFVLVAGCLAGFCILGGVDYLRDFSARRKDAPGFEVIQSNDTEKK
jgi:peptidoglycan/LPS O-acetylase OafA/YrhL